VYAQYQAILATSSYFETGIAEMSSVEESYAEVRALHIASLGNLPLIVLRRGRWDVLPFFSDDENQQAWDVSQELQSELAALSSEGKLIIAEQSGHTIQIDQPDLVIDAVREIVDANHK
jgi:pimeloyl-ACP methyl ester carboxylesterase